MRTRPISLTAQEVRDVLDGRKSQMRRPCMEAFADREWANAVFPARDRGWIAWFLGDQKQRADLAQFTKEAYPEGFRCRLGEVGDRLWAQEVWGIAAASGYRVDPCLNYRADKGQRPVNPAVIPPNFYFHDRWRGSSSMPRWASRLMLEIVSIRVERLQDITEADAVAEGMTDRTLMGEAREGQARSDFALAWEAARPGRGLWKSNGWVWVIEFRRLP